MPNYDYDYTHCPVTCWKGDPDHPMAANAACKYREGHGGLHLDKNGNHFDDDGVVITIRNDRRPHLHMA